MTGSSDIRLALTGRYLEVLREAGDASLEALHVATRETTDQARQELKADTLAAGLGGNVANAWRMKMYPPGKTRSKSPVGWIYSRAPHIVEAFEIGAKIGGGPRDPQVIPIPGSPADDLKNPRGPEHKLHEARRKFGELSFVPGRAGRAALLVAKNVRFGKTGRLNQAKLTKTGKYRKGAVDVPLFFVVPHAHLRKRLNLARVKHRAERRSTARIEHHLNVELRRRLEPLLK